MRYRRPSPDALPKDSERNHLALPLNHHFPRPCSRFSIGLQPFHATTLTNQQDEPHCCHDTCFHWTSGHDNSPIFE